jgi:hypothetical protein
MRLSFKHWCCVLICLIAVNTLRAQSVGIGKFTDHLPYGTCNTLCKAGNKIYVAAGPGLFVYDTQDGSVQTMSKINTLSDLGVNSIAYSEKHQTVLIGYTTGNIDVIRNNKITNVPDIATASIQGVKTINNILVKDDYAYLSTGFGIVKFDIQRIEIKETYLIGDNATNIQVNEITFFNDSIFAATTEGLYVAKENTVNLVDFQNWSILQKMGTMNYSAINSSDSILAVCLKSTGSHSDTILTYNKSIWDYFDFPNNNFEDIEDIEYQNDEWLIAYTKAAWIISDNLFSAQKVSTYNLPDLKGIKPTKIIPGTGSDYWISDNKFGLIHRNSPGRFESILPKGPYSYQSWDLNYANDELWVASGSLTPNKGNTYQKKGMYRYKNNTWTSFYKKGFDTISDLTSVTLSKFSPGLAYIGSWGKGLIEAKDGIIQNVFNATNSAISSNVISNHYAIGGSAFDKYNNLWVTVSGLPGANVPFPLVAYDGTDWTSFTLDNNLVTKTDIGDILVDGNGYKWMLSLNNGIFVFDDNGTVSDQSDDQQRLLATSESSGNLPTKLIYAIAEDDDGEMWIGTDEGLVIINNTAQIFEEGVTVTAERIIIEQDGGFYYLLETEKITAIKVDGGNRKWIGTASGGVYLISADGQETIHHFTSENSALFSDNIYDIEIFGSTGEVFFATDKGLISYMGDATDGDAYNGPTYAFPNPVRPDYTGLIGIKGLAENAEVKITDITGNVVYETLSEGTTATWDGNSLNGKRVQTGVYMVFSSSSDGAQKEVAKILFIN